MEDRSFHPLDYLSVVRRRKWWLIIPIVVCAIAGVVAAKLMPKEYQSEAKIGISAPAISPDLLRGLSSLDPVERQRAVAQHLLSTTVLDRVVREEKLFPESAKAEDGASWLRKRIEPVVDLPIGVSARTADRGFDSFRLAYRDSDPERTRRVANKLAQVFVEENSKFNEDRAENTAEVLGEQLKDSQTKLQALEAQLSAKKQSHMSSLPSMMEANISMANGARNQLESVTQQLATENSQLFLIETQIQQMQQGVGGSSMTATGSSALTSATSRLNSLQQQLAQARANGWGDKHPEVDSLNREIAQARAEIKALQQTPAADQRDGLKSDPIYQAKLAEREAVKNRINSLRAQANQLRGEISQFQARVAGTPVAEQALQSIQREYDLERTRLNDLNTQYQRALLQGSIARNQGGERFTILYSAGPAQLRSTPPIRIALMGLFFGVVLGAALVVGREFMDRSIHDARALQNEFDIPVLVEIPRIGA
jgi:polysaccharide biosynthesis transport protein